MSPPSSPMTLAISSASLAFSLKEVPIGCAIHHPTLGVISTGHNLVKLTRDATRHAELVAIDRLYTDGQCSDEMCLERLTRHKEHPEYVKRSEEEVKVLLRESTV